MSRTATRDGALGGAVAASTNALGGAETVQLQAEYERVRCQRLALEDQQRRARHTRSASPNYNGEQQDEHAEHAEEAALVAQPSSDPFACCCRPLKLKKLGQSYILRERRVVERGRVSHELILVGPHWVGVLVTLSIVVGSTALFLHQQCTLLPWYYSVITLCFCAVTLYYLYCVACKDPGIVVASTKKRSKTKQDDDDNGVAQEKDDRTTIVVDSDGDDDEDDEDALETGGIARVRGNTAARQAPPAAPWAPPPSYYSRFSPRARFCDVCEVSQDAYTEHCDDCGVCIEDYDHHCPWMGKCIGKKNMYAFKMFNVSWVFYVVFVLFVSIQNVDWGDMAVQRLHRLSTGEWVPMGTTAKPL